MLIGFMVFVVACSEDDALPSDDQEEEEQEEEEEEEETETIDMAVYKDLFYSDDVSKRDHHHDHNKGSSGSQEYVLWSE